MTDEDFLCRAIELSRINADSAEGGPFGAVVARDGAMIGEGNNRVTAERDPTAHAEVVAIRRACAHLGPHELAGAVIYTSCEPFPMCLAALLCAPLARTVSSRNRTTAAHTGPP